MSGPRFDEIEGEESHAAPRFDEIEEGEPPLTETSVRGKRPPPADLNVIQAPAKGPAAPWVPAADAFVEGGASGMSAGFKDEIAGLLGAGGYALDKVKDWAAPADPNDISAQDAPMGHQPKSLGEAFRSRRDQYRDIDRKIMGHPDAGLPGAAGELLGSVLIPVPGPGKATGVAKAARVIGTAAGVGGLFGLGGSKADLTKGEYGDAAKDVGKSAAISGGLAGGLMGLGKLVSVARSGAGNLAAKATDEAAALSAKARDKAVRSALGSVGSSTTEANRALENIESLSKYGSPEEQKRAADILASPEVAEMRRKILGNSSDRSGSAMSRIEEAEAALEKAKGLDPEALAKEGVWGTVKRAVVPRAVRLAGRVVPTIAGAHFGGTGGAIAGAVFSAAAGKPGTTAWNLLNDPNVRRHGWTAVEKVLSGASGVGGSEVGQWLAKYAPVIAAAIKAHGPEGGQAIHEALMSEDEGYAKDVAEQVAGAGP